MKLFKYKFIRDWYRKYNILLVVSLIILILGWIWYFYEPGNGLLCFCAFLSVYTFFYFLFYCVIISDFYDIDKEEFDYIDFNLKNKKYIYLKNIGVIAFDKFFVYMTHGFKVVKYNELIWSFWKIFKADGCSLVIMHMYFTDGNHKQIQSHNLINNCIKDFDNLLKIIKENNPDVEIEHNKEISKRMSKIIRALEK